MATRQIRLKDDELLRKKSRKVDKINNTIKVLLDDMAETMYEAEGVGLAAPQVGILRRVVVIDIGDDNGLIELINPIIVEVEGEQINSEGCLSVPGESGFVKRPETVKVSFMDRIGDEYEIEAEGLLAIALCHEIDHLEGVLYIDKVITDPDEIDKLKQQKRDEESEDEKNEDEE